ncbi:endothelial lipase-like isoform X2 [Narcine bancroftii]|uniref:endothelial lipase-like isoform X2 n=1 Tax=Narcine bancroftii TaxID=1343680 RepID=UPI003831248F
MSCLAVCVSLLSLLSTGSSENSSKDTLTGKAVQDVLHKETLSQHYRTIETKFNLQSSTKDCPIFVGVKESLLKCNFNNTSKTFIIIHGWTTTGLMESWISAMVKALQKQETHANVIVINWLERAHQLYTTAVNNSEVVGKEVAILIDWLKQVTNLPLQKMHLIGYSLGAHVAGHAGKYAKDKIGRITGLDPAGPMYEGTEPDKRLSPDDAEFVDVLHTFAYSPLGFSIGIEQPIGHIDVYPNGGSFQPGCGLHNVIHAIANGNIGEIINCEHERSVLLFVDSIINQDMQSLMYRCPDKKTFEKGMCLSCRKNRCNKLGYNVNKIRSKRNHKMYLKTRADMPFKVFHYQLKMHLFSAKEIQGTNPKLHVNLYGTENDSKKTNIEIYTFCANNPTTKISPGNELTFVKCLNGWPVKNKTSLYSRLLQ